MMIIKALVLVVVLVAFAANVNTTPIKRNLIVFGDSISDSGNSKVNGWPQLPYYNGRYTNGKTWNEYLPQLTGMRMINYAFAAATSDSDISQGVTHGEAPIQYHINAPGVKQLIKRYLAENWMSSDDIKDSCAVIWLNGVNYLANPFNTGKQVADSIVADIQMLYDAGFRCYLFGDMIDPSKFPKYATLPFVLQLIVYGKYLDHVAAYGPAITDWTNNHKDANVIRYNPNDDFTVLMDPKQNPLKLNPTDPCTHEAVEMGKAIDECGHPNTHVFWDPLHPTTVVHSYLAGSISKKLITS